MAATNYIVATTIIDPKSPDDFANDVSTGGTLTTASAVLELVYDETAFTKAEGKIRLIRAVEHLLNHLKESKTTWPLT